MHLEIGDLAAFPYGRSALEKAEVIRVTEKSIIFGTKNINYKGEEVTYTFYKPRSAVIFVNKGNNNE